MNFIKKYTTSYTNTISPETKQNPYIKHACKDEIDRVISCLKSPFKNSKIREDKVIKCEILMQDFTLCMRKNHI